MSQSTTLQSTTLQSTTVQSTTAQSMIMHIINIHKSLSMEELYDAIDRLCMGTISKIIYTVSSNDSHAEAFISFENWTGVPEEMPEGEFMSFMPDSIKSFVNDIESCTYAYIPFIKVNGHESWLAKNATDEHIEIKSKIKNQKTFLKIQEIPGDIEPKNVTAMFAILGSIDALEFIWSTKMQTIEQVLQGGIMCKIYVQFEDAHEMYMNLKTSGKTL